MNSKRAYYLTLGLLVLLTAGIFLSTAFATKLLGNESAKLVDIKLQNKLLDEQQVALVQANKSAETYAGLDEIARTIVPQDKDQAKAVREIVKVSGEAGIKLGAISFPASTLGQVKSAAVAKTGGGETQVKPVAGIPGVYVMEITIQQDSSSPISYTKLIDFLQRLENNRRTAQVTNVSVQPIPQDRNKLSFNMTVNAYIKP